MCRLALLVVQLCALGLATARISDKYDYLPKSVTFSVPNWVHRSKLRGGGLLLKEESEHGKAYAQDYEDIIATNRYFHDRHNGVFLELGAADGRFCSNTKLFEDSRGWRGVLIEPNPEEYRKIPAERPNSISVNAAICDRKQDVHFVGRMAKNNTLRSAGAVGGLWEFMSPEFRRQWYGSEDAIPEGATVTSCLPLQSILRHFNITHIDFFSLDVEGAELEVLKTLDLSAVHINVIVVEQDSTNPGKDEAVRQLLSANGFAIDEQISSGSGFGRNDWFVHESFQPFEAPEEHVWLTI